MEEPEFHFRALMRWGNLPQTRGLSTFQLFANPRKLCGGESDRTRNRSGE
jgi:hypothetical protein